jgi:hypothetical protein
MDLIEKSNCSKDIFRHFLNENYLYFYSDNSIEEIA